MRDADILSEAIKKAQKNGYDFANAKLGTFYLLTEEFAKAFWGIYPLYDLDIKLNGKQIKKCGLECWAYHLMIMSVNNPIKYVEKFL